MNGKSSLLQRLLVLGLITGSLFQAGCSSKSIYKDLTDDPRILVRQWTIQTRKEFESGDHGTEHSNPVVYQNTLVFGNSSIGLVALYPTLNQIRWVLPIENGVVSELTIEDRTVYFGGGDGFLYSVNLDTGRVNWRYEVRVSKISKPTLANGRLFITTASDTVYAFDAGSGEWLWHYRRTMSQNSSVFGASAPLVVGGDVLAGLSDGYLVALSIQDGKLKWESKLHRGYKFTDVDAHPVLEEGVIYVPSYDGSLYALKQGTSGEVIWRFDAGGADQIAIEDNRVYLPSSNGSLYALDKVSGKVIWKFDLDSGVPTNIVITRNHLIFGSSYQYLYALDKKTGQPVYRFNAGYGSGFYGSPSFDEKSKRLYILSGSGNLYSFLERSSSTKTFPHGKTDPYIFYPKKSFQ